MMVSDFSRKKTPSVFILKKKSSRVKIYIFSVFIKGKRFTTEKPKRIVDFWLQKGKNKLFLLKSKNHRNIVLE
jgi:hypothetical protein